MPASFRVSSQSIALFRVEIETMIWPYQNVNRQTGRASTMAPLTKIFRFEPFTAPIPSSLAAETV
jgi:hypothetical protein